MIRASQYHRDFRNAVQAFLSKYFDGTNHTFGKDTLLFPQVDIAFDRPQLGNPLPKPLLVLSPLDDRKVSQQITKYGRLKVLDQPLKFIVYTSEVNRVWDKNYEVQDLLDPLFSGAAGVLNALGLKVMRIGGVIPISLDSSQEFQVTQRLITLRAELEYGVAGTGVSSVAVSGGII